MIAVRQRAVVGPRSVPRLAPHVRLHFDRVRGAWAVLAPERVLWPDATGLDILQRCDGTTPVRAIVTALAADYAAPEEEIAADVTAFLQGWADRLLVRL